MAEYSFATPNSRNKRTSTKAPTGLAIKRDGWNFTCSWKIGDNDYGAGQYFAWGYTIINDLSLPLYNSDGQPAKATRDQSVGTYAANEIKISSTDTSRTVTVPANECFPNKANRYLTGVFFIVRGCRANFTVKEGNLDVNYTCEMSQMSYADWKPVAPLIGKSLTATLSTYNRCNFAWEFNNDATVKEWVLKYEWEAILLKNSSITDGSKVSYKTSDSTYLTGSGTDLTGSRLIVEDATAEGWRTTNTYTRWMRIRGVGPKGYGPWRYAKHVYAQPSIASITYGKATIRNAVSTLIYLQWTLDVTATRPLDSIIAQYLIGTPADANLSAPSSGWVDSPVGEMTDTSGTDGVSFVADSIPTLDQCIWGRLVSTYDNDPAYSSPYLIYKSGLSAPSDLNVTVNSDTHMATVSASNNSSVPGSWLAVVYTDAVDYKGGFVIARIPDSNPVTIQCPNWADHAISFSVYAVHGTYSYSQLKGNPGVNVYTVKPNMVSTTVKDGGEVPLAPANVVVSPYSISETINVSWAWNWTGAELAELSWADHEDAWTSTSGPSTYTVDRIEAPSWNISGLTTGRTWYVRVRFGNTVDGNTVYGPYSDTKSLDITIEPSPPTLNLSKTVITADESVTATWLYNAFDDSSQASADIAIVTVNNGELVYTNKVHVTTAQRAELDASKMGWVTGETYSLAVCVTSDNGRKSEWSNTTAITIADPVTAVITEDTFEHDYEIVSDDGSSRTITALTELPLTVRVIGAGTSNMTLVSISRIDDYHVDRPDESQFDGYAGETIAVLSQIGDDEIIIDRDNLIGHLDDSSAYRLTATVTDDLGQRATDSIDFEVYWSHQAIIPEGTAIIDGEHQIAVLTPIAPDGTLEGDVCDIYRLSIDRPELVYESAEFGSMYVDPYPTIGEKSGYRFVFRTSNNDYITPDNRIAWLDIPTPVYSLYSIINFGTDRVDLMYNVDLSTKWSKDFKETKYLGGAIQGDWNPAVSRTGTVSSVTVAADSAEMIETVRRLAVYPGICRIRTRDGSNYSADVQVSENRGHEELDLTADFSMSFTRVDPDERAGITYDEWAEMQDDVTRYLSVYLADEDERIKYTITYSTIISDEKLVLVITKITASGTWTGGTTVLQISVDETELYSGTDIDGSVSVTISDEWNRTSVHQEKVLTLTATSTGTVSAEETNTSFIQIPPLNEEE